MKERPINFKAWEVQAIRAGRKTQFRRVVNPQPEHRWNVEPDGTFCRGEHEKGEPCEAHTERLPCPYGAPGDRLWVRETWMDAIAPDGFCGADQVRRGPKSEKLSGWIRVAWHKDTPDPWGWPIRYGWRSPVCMPRWASRFDLEIVSRRVERLQDISEEDAKAEGVQRGAVCDDAQCDDDFGPMNFVDGYQIAWESINGPGSWGENQFVWVVEFRQV